MLAVPGNSMPQITAGGSVDMTIHQVNGDGAGPYTCEIDATGTGTAWQPMTVTQNVPGERSRSDARAQDFVSFLCSPFNLDLINILIASLRHCRG